MAIVLPAAYHFAFPNTMSVVNSARYSSSEPEGEELTNLLKMSRGLSFILLAVYAMFLMFQLWTHAYLFRLPRSAPTHNLSGPQPTNDHVFPRPQWVPSIVDSSSSSSSSSASSHSSATNPSRFRRFRRWSKGVTDSRSRSDSDPSNDRPRGPVESPAGIDEEASIHGIELQHDHSENLPNPHAPVPDMDTPPVTATRTSFILPENPRTAQANEVIEEEDDEHYVPPVLINPLFAVLMLTTMTALAGVTAEWLVDSIDGLTETSAVSREFVGLILLPVIGNSVEHITAVTVSVKDKLNLSMSIAVGSSIQVSLCILPILVLIGWAIGQPMLLFFDTFETITLVISVLLVNFAISDGRTNYLEGFVLMMAYVSIALVCWFYDPVQ